MLLVTKGIATRSKDATSSFSGKTRPAQRQLVRCHLVLLGSESNLELLNGMRFT